MATCPKCKQTYPDGTATCASDGEALLPDAAFAGVEPDLAPGALVGEYAVETKLGEGGFGTVFKATHPLIGKQAAIKVLHRQFSANPHMVARFISEARAVNEIRSRNIIDIFSFGQLADGRHYYVMELLEGQPLDGYVRARGHLEVGEVLAVLRGLARALDAAHAKGIAHRDIKPENVFIVDDEGVPFPKLLDFGIAKLLSGDAPQQHKTKTGAPMGTPQYMSPEQCRGRGVDHRTDIYAFGVLAYELLAGRVPFEGDDFMGILMKQISDAPEPPSRVGGIPEAFDAPILAMLAKEPADRPQTLAEAVAALEEAAAAAGVTIAAPRAAALAKPTANRATPVPGATRATPVRAGALASAPTMSPEALLPASYNVYIEKARDPSPAGRAKLAAAIAARFRLPEATVEKSLEKGRLRVKSNVDEAAARAFARDLEALGAITSIGDAAAGAPARTPPGPAPTAAPLPRPAPAPTPAKAAASIPAKAPAPTVPAAPAPAPTPVPSVVAPAPAAPATTVVPPPAAPPAFESGLAAASSGRAQDPSALGALSEFDPGSLTIGALDGTGDSTPAATDGMFAPPPADDRDKKDAFAAPGTFAPAEEDEEIQLAEVAKKPPAPSRPKEEAPPPPAAAAAAARTPGPSLVTRLRRPAARVALGLVLALAIGYVPAEVYAQLAERRYAAIGRDFDSAPRPATLAEWSSLEDRLVTEVRPQLAAAKSRTRTMFGVIWLITGVAVGFGWERLTKRE